MRVPAAWDWRVPAFALDRAIVGLGARSNAVEVDVATLGFYAGECGPWHLCVVNGRTDENPSDQ